MVDGLDNGVIEHVRLRRCGRRLCGGLQNWIFEDWGLICFNLDFIRIS